MDQGTFHLLGIAGSLRHGSYNRGLLRAAAEVLPAGVSLETYSLDDIPLFNADVLALGDPPPVRELKERIWAADALLIATPENNYSIPGVLKNAIDWVSRPMKTSCLRGKPIGIVGASTGEGGTIRAQHALRQVFVLTDSLVMAQPELRVAGAAQKFDAEGTLLDAELRHRLATFVEALVDWARLVGVRGQGPAAAERDSERSPR
jgi:chromate reductase